MLGKVNRLELIVVRMREGGTHGANGEDLRSPTITVPPGQLFATGQARIFVFISFRCMVESGLELSGHGQTGVFY